MSSIQILIYIVLPTCLASFLVGTGVGYISKEKENKNE